MKYCQQSTAAASNLLPEPDLVHFISFPAHVITEVPLPPKEYLSLSMFKYYMERIYVMPTKISLLEENTRDQSSSAHWHKARQYCITNKTIHLKIFFSYSSSKFYTYRYKCSFNLYQTTRF